MKQKESEYVPNADRPPLIIGLLGPLDVQVNGVPLTRLRSRKGQELLALLALRYNRQVEREWLTGTLWPESPASQANYNLRRSLSDLRQALGEEGYRLHSPNVHTLSLDLSGATVDLLAFDTAIAQGDDFSLEMAVDLYRGPLLEGCLEEWVLQERAAREQAYLAALETLAARQVRSDPAKAAAYLRRVIAVEPADEPAQRNLMAALAAEGDHAAVSRAYHAFCLYLHRELNAAPASETISLYQRLRTQSHSQALPSSQSPPAPPRRFPRPLNNLVGRQDEKREVTACLQKARLVTLTGIGGVGKTRLAIAVAEEVADDYLDGAWFIDLAALSDPAFVPHVVAGVLGIYEEPERKLTAALSNHLKSESLLLILDNCEHLIEACAQLAQMLLSDCPALRLLTTSRQSLGIPGECVYQVPSLSVPPPYLLSADKDLPPGLMECEAIQLFVERAHQTCPAFKVTPQNLQAVVQIVDHLDGLPLAIELAAARVKSLPPEQIAARLQDCLGLLNRGNRTALPRQQTLQATMDWSYELLKEQERLLLRRLAVFVGGWTLEAAEAVCAGEGIEDGEVLDVLTNLIDKSLVVYEEQSGQARYRLLGTIRQYSRERLGEQSLAADRLYRRHRDYYLAYIEEAKTHLIGPEQAHWLDKLETEHDNLRAVLTFCCEDAQGAEAGMLLAASLEPFWSVRGYFSEGRRCLESALAHDQAQSDTLERAKALNAAGTLAKGQSDYDTAQAWFEESLALCRKLDFKRGVTGILNNLGNLARDRGDYGAARRLLEQALTLNRESGNRSWEAYNLSNLGTVALYQGDYDSALGYFEQSLGLERELSDKDGMASSLLHIGNVFWAQGGYAAAQSFYEQSLALNREMGDEQGLVCCLNNLGLVAYALDDFVEARRCFERSLIVGQEIGAKGRIASTLSNLGPLFCKQGDFPAARASLVECLMLCREIPSKYVTINALEGTATLARNQQQPQRAACLYSAAAALRKAVGLPYTRREQQEHDRHIAAIRALLGEETFALARTTGQAMSMQEAIDYALKDS